MIFIVYQLAYLSQENDENFTKKRNICFSNKIQHILYISELVSGNKTQY
jgi:hypothetical protein